MLELKETIGDAARKANRIANGSGHQAQAATRTAGDEAKEATSGVAGAVKEAVHDVATAASELFGKATDKAQEWASSVGDAAVHAKDKAQQVTSATVQKTGDLGKDVKALIHRYPVAALLVGVGTGFLLGQVLNRSSSRSE